MRMKLLLFALVFSLFLTSSVLAFGISSSYFKDNPLKISPGQTIKPILTFQNMVGTEDVKVSATIISGGDIAKLGKTIYNVPLGSNNIIVDMTIKIPEDAPIGQQYRVGVSYNLINSDQSGQMSLGTAMDAYFPILVVGTEESYVKPTVKSNTTLYLIFALILIVLLVIVYFLKRKKKTTSKKRK